MTEPRVVVVALSLLFAGCGGLTALSPTAPSPAASSLAVSPQSSVTSPPTGTAPVPAHAVGPDVPAGLVPTQQVITGAVGPLANYPAPCYVERYPCERYRFALQSEGAAEVTLAWQGGARAMLIQLYRAGAGLIHEDLAPRDGAPTITFRRVDLPAIEYELRVVNMEPDVTHPFTLTLTTWQ
jgi:hypothetical protein